MSRPGRADSLPVPEQNASDRSARSTSTIGGYLTDDIVLRNTRENLIVAGALAAAVFLPGLAIGSFLNVVAARLPLGRSVVHPASECPHCHTPIARRDNIPVVSWLLLRGRCRSCHAAIAWRYPAVELLTARARRRQLRRLRADAPRPCSPRSSAPCSSPSRRSTSSATSSRTGSSCPPPGSCSWRRRRSNPSLEWLLAGLGAATFFFVAALAYPGGMGMGDVKLALLLGFMLGRTVPIAIFVGMITALVPSVVLLARHGSAARKMKIPFGPFLAFGGVVGLFLGGAILDAYLGTM